MATYTENDLRNVTTRYEAARKAALAERDASLRAFAEAGWRPVDIQQVTGYSRETIRQALQPQARDDINANRRRLTAARRGRYIIVPKTLDELRGPTTGLANLPADLADPHYPSHDLANPQSVSWMYAAIIERAQQADDLREWIDPNFLVKVWPILAFRLGPPTRDKWEGRFPALRESARNGWSGRRSTSWT